jgi:D-alanyl-D-alanine carboxypeptidase
LLVVMALRCWRLALALAAVAGGLSFGCPVPAAASAAPTYFATTGFAIDDPAFLDYFDHRGGVATFGYPISRRFTFEGFPVQMFQRAIMQRYPDGHVQLLNVLDPAMFPYTRVNGATFPAADSALVRSAPAVGSANYGPAILRWIASTAPDRWQGLPVGFDRRFLATVPAAAVRPGSPAGAVASAGFDLEVWGVPTSAPAYDPNNHAVVYQRFQRGILQYDAITGRTQGVLLADYFKSILLGTNLPADLRAAAATSPYYAQYDPSGPGWVARPSQLPATDLTDAFVPDGPTQAVVAGVPVLAAAPVKTGSGAAPLVDAWSVAVVDGDSGALLYGKDPHRRLAPASITKIFTALVALERGDLHQEIRVQFDQAGLTAAGSTVMGIRPGETYSLEDLLYGLMLPSGGDAAEAIANAVGGSQAGFVALMNQEAAGLGLNDSHFTNPHGLDAPGLYSSAYDMALAARYGMARYPEFRALAQARTWTVHGSRSFPVYNLNRFLWSYPGADGVKIGYDDNAGKTIVASATRHGHRVFVVLMHCGDIVNDSVPLFNWAFANFSWPTRTSPLPTPTAVLPPAPSATAAPVVALPAPAPVVPAATTPAGA